VEAEVKEEAKEEQIVTPAPAQKKVVAPKQKAEVKEESEDSAVDDWETADLDDIVDKVKSKKDVEVVKDAEDEDVLTAEKDNDEE
jgi:hypothetical protein